MVNRVFSSNVFGHIISPGRKRCTKNWPGIFYLLLLFLKKLLTTINKNKREFCLKWYTPSLLLCSLVLSRLIPNYWRTLSFDSHTLLCRRRFFRLRHPTQSTITSITTTGLFLILPSLLQFLIPRTAWSIFFFFLPSAFSHPIRKLFFIIIFAIDASLIRIPHSLLLNSLAFIISRCKTMERILTHDLFAFSFQFL